MLSESIKQDSRGSISTVSNPWVSDNTDGLFFKADTLRLINNKTQYDFGFCEKVNWSFYIKSKFYQVESQTCEEPASVKVSNINNQYQITLSKNKLGLILSTSNLNGLVDQYLVVSINRDHIKDEIVLKRITKNANRKYY
ncbi:hypothetical protein [Aquimarina brevivitae]|uniref:Uncharacterized protein n=1 Tax=Aquimarina brevivitae TaxID=323412 RepID=A0A4Q7PI23_9FLAO|nr:hypothetical protein [Aquimarina brevivitae]RZT00244.1 hypothetical protein EV197_1480 [Aquimarina brevivitae]